MLLVMPNYAMLALPFRLSKINKVYNNFYNSAKLKLQVICFLHPSWQAKPASWGVLRLFWIACVYINYVCAHHNA